MKSKPSGNTTTTTINPTQQAQLPFLQSGWGSAQDLYNNNPYSYYPNQTLATPNSYLPQGYNSLAGSAQTGMDMLPGINSLFSGMTSGVNNIYNSPAFSGLSDIASGSNAYLGASAADAAYLNDLARQAGSTSGENPYAPQLAQLAQEAGVHDYGMNSLQNTASGMYLNSNPYLDSMFGSASDAVTRAYQTATAPTSASSFSGAGRYGSGAYANMASQNQQDLGSSLGNLSANIYGGNYQAERARQDAASQALSSLMQQNYGLQGNLINQAGNLTNQAGQLRLAGLGQAAQDTSAAGQLSLANLGAQQNALNTTQSGYQAGNQQQLAALGLFPSLMQAQYAPSQAMIQAGQGLTGLDQAQIQDQMNRFYGEQSAPWTNLNQYMNAIGQPTTGSNSQTQPYFTNPLANVLGAGIGGLGLYNGMNSAFGKGGSDAALFGGVGDMGLGALASGVGADAAWATPELLSLIGIISDRRLKRDIEHVGVLPNGLSIYNFRYLWDDEPQVGLMADEVERVHPDAVISGPFGFKAVDYTRAVQPVGVMQ